MKLLELSDHNDVAAYFGTSYKQLGAYLYDLNDKYKYKSFSLAKKSGGTREIDAPKRRMREIQSKLSNDLYTIYPGRISAHGFALNKSIVTNAQRHLDKKYVFNIDLQDFFGCIHFGRIKHLFMSEPFRFAPSVATILAQICCHKNALPQGAPTSPVLSNMICWKLDAQLQHLAKTTNSTYTRYADDITFSFTCSKKRLPDEVVVLREGEPATGSAITEIIHTNGFSINYSKVRLAGPSQRQEVTGLTVNKFPNVPRKYVRQIGSILHAWEKYGYESTELEFNERFDARQRASDTLKSLESVVKGKLAFLRSVRGPRDPVFQKLAIRFNKLVDDENTFRIIKETISEQSAIDALWVLEACYDNKSSEVVVSQGSGFMLDEFGLITCAHVVVDRDGQLIEGISAYQPHTPTQLKKLRVEYLDQHRDIAICSIDSGEGQKSLSLLKANEVVQGMEGKLLGFPAYKAGQSASIFDVKVSSTYPHHGIKKFEIDTQIRDGNSGGPVIDTEGDVLGVALEGAKKDSGANAVLVHSELWNVHTEDYKT